MISTAFLFYDHAAARRVHDRHVAPGSSSTIPSVRPSSKAFSAPGAQVLTTGDRMWRSGGA